MPPLVILHLAALGVYIASCLYLLVLLLPAARREPDPARQRERLAGGFRVQNPVSIGALGVVLMTGAIRLTDLKAALGPLFFVQLGRALALKLTLAFLVINVATYVAFGIGHRLVRSHQGGLPIDATVQAGMLRRARGATWLALLLTLATAWLSTEMGTLLR
jgi:hypothetical protein